MVRNQREDVRQWLQNSKRQLQGQASASGTLFLGEIQPLRTNTDAGLAGTLESPVRAQQEAELQLISSALAHKLAQNPV